ncbi:PLP-dependent transferase [Flavobacteriaceae bacterium]|nr:PLP-dependent transferase [Flavobacteriaceae bacterium]
MKKLLSLFFVAALLVSCNTNPKYEANLATDEIKEEIGINKGLIRLSVGIENVNDIINDLNQAFKEI